MSHQYHTAVWLIYFSSVVCSSPASFQTFWGFILDYWQAWLGGFGWAFTPHRRHTTSGKNSEYSERSPRKWCVKMLFARGRSIETVSSWATPWCPMQLERTLENPSEDHGRVDSAPPSPPNASTFLQTSEAPGEFNFASIHSLVCCKTH